MVSRRNGKLYYSEKEAARELGISVEKFRTLLVRHIVDGQDDLKQLPTTSFQPSDLLLLRLLASQQIAPSPAH